MQGSSTAERPGRARVYIGAIVSTAIVGTFGVVAERPVYALSDEQRAIRDGLATVSDALAGLDSLDELAEALPLSGLLPTSPAGLDVVASVRQVLDDALAVVGDGALESEFEAAINDLNGDDLGGGVVVDVSADVSDDGISFSELRFTKTGTTALDLTVPGLALDGTQIGFDLELDLTANGPFVVSLDTAPTPDEIYLADSTPNAELSASLQLDADPGVELDLGIVTVDATGNPASPGVPDIAASVSFTIDWLDPDGNGRIDVDDLTTAAPLDLFDVSFGTSSVDLELAVTAASAYLPSLTAGGTIALHDDDLADGLAEPDIELGELGNFTNMTPEEVLTSIAHLAVSLQAMQTRVANLDLPVLGADPNAPEGQKTVENLADLLDVNSAIGDWFVSLQLSAPDSPFELRIGDIDGSGQVDNGENGTIDLGERTLADLGLDDIDGIIDQLATALGDEADLDYDAATNALTFDLSFDSTYVPPAAIVAINDQLDALGLKGLATLNGIGGVSFDASYAVSVGFGIDLSANDLFAGHDDEDPPPLTDRLFIETDGAEIVGDAFVCADLDLAGTLGFLELTLADDDADPSDACGLAGQVPLLQRRATGDNADREMVRIDVDGGSDGRITLTELFDQLAALDVVPVTDGLQLAAGSGADAVSVTGTINARVPDITLVASATLGDAELGSAGALGQATLTFGIPDLLDPTDITTSANADFNDNFLAFNLDSENPLALFNSIIDLIDQSVGLIDTVDSGGGSVLDEDLPIIGTSFRDSVAFLDEVRDTVNSIASDPSGSLQRLEAQLQIAIAEGMGIDLANPGGGKAGLPPLPDPNDPAYVFDPDPFVDGDEYFDDALFQTALLDYYDALDAFFTDAYDFVDLGYEPGNSPGAITITLKFGVCSTIDAEHPGCTRAIPLTKAFNFDLDQLGADFAGLVAAEAAGEVQLDYNAAVQLDLGVQLPDVAGGQFAPQPFVMDTSFVDLRLAGEVDAAFDASIGPFQVTVGNLTPLAESDGQCSNAVDDDGDGFVNDGCPPVGAASESGAQCAAGDAVNDDPADDDTADGTDDDPDSPDVVNDGCPEQAASVQAEAGAAFRLEADHGAAGASRVLLSDLGAYATSLVGSVGGDLGDDTDGPGGFGPNPGVACGATTDVFACASLPVFVNAGGDDLYLGTIDGAITGLDPFTHTFDPDDVNAIAQGLIDNADTLAFQLIGQGLQEFGDYVAEATNAASYDVEIPVVGDFLDAGADVAITFNDGFAQPFGTFLGGFDPSDTDAVETELEAWIFGNVGPAGPDLLLDNDGDGDVDVDDVVVEARCGDPAVDCVAGTDGVFDISDLSVDMRLGQTIAETDPIPFDFGFPGLRLATTDGDGDGHPDGATAAVDWAVQLGFGLSRTEGFYLVNEAGNEISLVAHVNTPDLEADIAFLGVEIDSGNEEHPKPAGRSEDELFVDLGISLGDTPGRLSLSDLANVDPEEFLPTLSIGVDLYWRIATAPEFGGANAGDGTLPTLRATIDVAATAVLTTDGLDFAGPGATGDMVFAFDDITLDLGSFVGDFLGPILAEVQNFTKPLQPVIDVVTAPIPGISQLAELVGEDPVTMLTLFEAISGNDLTLIKTLLEVIAFVNALPADPSGLGEIAIGEFDIDVDKVLDTELPANQKSELIAFRAPTPGGISSAIGDLNDEFSAAFADNLAAADPNDLESEEPGFTFPAFEDFGQLFNLLVGQDVTLVRFASGPLKAEFGFSQSFGPIAVGPIPVSIVISGSASIEGRFAVGYDTKGVRQLVKGIVEEDPGLDLLTGFGYLFNGLFLDDLNAAGQDVPEIRLVVEFAAGAAVDLVIVSAGVEGGVRATIDMNLHDGGFFDPVPPENLDGKLRLDEIASFLLLNPICLFDVSGKLEAFIRIFVEIDLFLFSARFEFTVVNITLLELDNITAELCEPPPPVLASDIGDGVLRLNMGPNAGARNYAPDTTDEKFTVRALGGDAVEVTAFGLIQTYGPNADDYDFAVAGGVQKVVADGGTGKDTIRFDPGSENEIAANGEDVEGTEIPFDIPTIVCGGPSDDKVFGGEAVDRVIGDGDQTQASPGAGWDCTTAEDVDGANGDDDGNDEVSGLGSGDVLYGLGGVDTLSGDGGDDEVRGGSDDDVLNGGIGGDTIAGDAGDDNIKGGADRDPSLAEVPDDESNDVIDGGPGIDTIDADHGDDTVDAGAGNDVVVAGPGIDTVHGDEDEDQIFGNDGDDDLFGDAGDDVIYGMLGDDDIRGGGDDDNLLGNEGDDDIEGGDGKDVVLGDMGVINRAQDPGASSLSPLAGKPLVELQAYPSGEPSDPGDTDLSGGQDTDVVYGQEGDDTIEGGSEADELHGNAGVDTISGDGGADVMFGDAGDDVMYGDDAAASDGCDLEAPFDTAKDLVDTMKGGDGDDTMSGNADADVMFGDDGADLMFGDADTPAPACDGDDTMYGGPLDDYQFGNNQDDAMSGQGGQDRLVGGSDEFGAVIAPDGSDTMSGGTGDDTLAGDNATMVDLDGGAVEPDTLVITTFLDGQGAGDTIFGDAGTDRVFGQAGDDDIFGGADQDFLEGNADSDVIEGGTGDDRISGGSSARSVIDDGTPAPVPYHDAPDAGDVINGNGGDDVIAGDNADIGADGTTDMTAANGSGISGDDLVHGNDDQDRIYGQLGSDELHGDDDEDYVVGDLGFIAALPDATLPVWPGGAPNHDVELDVPGPEVTASDDASGGADQIFGGDADDHLFGGTGVDLVEGNGDDDYLEGNSGADSMYGNGDGLELGDDEDDMIGGWSSWTRDTSLVRLDEGETIMQGNGDHDVMLGDNGDIERVVDGAVWADDDVISGARKRGVTLLDREKSETAFPEVRGPDRMQGNDGSDRMFGEGDSDLVQGNGDDDFVEGNQSGDWLEGNDGEDDVIGGSSFLAAVDGLPLAGAGPDLGDPDGDDAIFGGGDADVIAGDNARILRDTSDAYDTALADAYFTTDHADAVPGWWLGVDSDRLVILLDRSTVHPGRFGADVMSGGAGEDVAFGQDGDDWVGGGNDDDALEGNGGGDQMFGDLPPYEPGGVPTPGTEGNTQWAGTGFVSDGADRDGSASVHGEDDIVGGSNVTHRDGDDDVHGDGEDDFVLGDDGTLQRWIVDDAYRGHVGDGARERWFRTATQLDPGVAPADAFGDDALDGNDGDDAIWGQDGDDLIRGQAGDDDLLGELGDDEILGGLGEDAVIGDRGSILNSELGAEGALFVQAPSTGDYSGPPFLTGVDYFVAGRFDRRVDLQLDVTGSVGGPFPGSAGAAGQLDQPGITTGGDDLLRGGPGHDSMHGAWGDDLVNGDEGGDWLFGSHGSDVMWGGYGDATGSPALGADYTLVDRLFGGRGGDPANDAGVVTGGADLLDYKPRTVADGGYDDPQAWHDAVAPYTDGAGGGADEPQHHQGTDWIYGGYDRDVMQGNVTDPGPNAGDRMWDWTGAYNLYTHCDPDYGGYNDQRARSPQMESFLEQLAFDSGVGSSLADVQTSSSSAYRELALVYKFDTRDNNGKAYPTTPGHFDEIAGCGEVPDEP